MCVCVCVGGGGGQVIFHVVTTGGGGGGGGVSLDLNLIRRGVIQNLDDGSKFQPAPLTLK